MINLSKGGRVNLSKDDNGNKLSKVFFGANWGAIKYMGLRIYTTADGRPVTRPNSNPNVLAKYNLDNDSKDPDTTFVGREAIILGYAYRKDGEWKFKALGNTGSWQSIGEIERVLPNFI